MKLSSLFYCFSLQKVSTEQKIRRSKIQAGWNIHRHTTDIIDAEVIDSKEKILKFFNTCNYLYLILNFYHMHSHPQYNSQYNILINKGEKF